MRELTIGEFSRATHLSVKTLRHYHEVGLLEPETVNPGNRYRLYTGDQIATAQVIRRLRDLDMPVADVRAVLRAGTADDRNALIARHLDRLEGELARTRAAVEALRRLVDPAESTHGVEHRTVAARPAVAIREIIDREDVLTWWRGALAELHATADARGLQRTGPIGGVFANELLEDDRGEAIVYLPVTHPSRTIGRAAPMVVPAAELVVAIHRGTVADIDLTYGQLGAYVAQHELSVDGPVRETYVTSARDTLDEAAWVTEIGWPVFGLGRLNPESGAVDAGGRPCTRMTP
jgi:DNA-binding transcriptional MerR regulator